jgi:signal transduction histidine kinase
MLSTGAFCTIAGLLLAASAAAQNPVRPANGSTSVELPVSSPAAEQPSVAANDGQKRVLALYPTMESQPSLSAFDAEYAPALNEALEGRLDYYREYMDSGRVPATDEYLSSFRNFLWRKYEHRPPDLVIAYSRYVVEFVERYRGELFPRAPVLFFGVQNDPVPGPIVTTNGDWSGSLEFALRLQPRTKHVFVIGGASDYDRYYSDFIRTLFRAFEGQVTLTYLIGRPLPELERKVATLPRDSIIYFVVMTEDGAGRRFEAWSGLERIAAAANAPIYAGFDTMLGHGAVGGRVWTTGRVVRPMVAVSVRLLGGEPPESIPPTVIDPFTHQLDWRQVKRWGIDERLAPAGTTILFRQATVWELYAWYIVGALSLVFLQTLLVATLVVQRAKRHRAEVVIRKNERDLHASYDRIRQLAGQLISAQEAERTRIARDLHDDIGQRVASVSIALSRIQRQIPDVASPARQSLSDLEHQSMQLSADLRHLSHELHPGALEHLGLLEALRERCDDFSHESGVPVQLAVSEAWRDVSDAHALCLYRVAQEALRNVATHARARNVTVLLDRLDGHLMMQVTDDGCGFDPTAPSRRPGLGLVSLSERVRMLGGQLVVTAAPDAGTCIAVKLPIGESHAP